MFCVQKVYKDLTTLYCEENSLFDEADSADVVRHPLVGIVVDELRIVYSMIPFPM